MQEKVRITLLVATYNRGGQLMHTLESIYSQSLDRELWEAVVVNNNSSDDTAALFGAFTASHPQSDNMRMVFEGRQGLSNARNCGIAHSRGEYIAIIDDDEQINREFLQQYAEFFDTHPDAAAAGGKMEPCYEYETPRWLSPYVEQALASTIDMGGKVRLFKGGKYPIGGNMAFRREVFAEYGDFDPNLGRSGKKLLGGEEKDMFDRLRKAGRRIYWVPGPTVLHIIPRERLTREHLSRLARMIGLSERMRTLAASRRKYAGRLVSEAVKWAGTVVISAGYLLSLRPAKAGYLFILRRNITLGLLNVAQNK